MRAALTFLICFVIVTAQAQTYDFSVSESRMVLGGDMNNTLSVKIYENTEKDIIKAWKSEMKKNGAKVDIDKEITANNVLLKDMSDLPFNCFANVKELENSCFQLNVSVYLGGSYLNFSEHPEKYQIFAGFLSDFARSTSVDAIEELLKMAKQDLNKKTSDLKKLEDTKEKLERDIENWEKDIQKAKDDIEINILEQEDKIKEVRRATEILDKEKEKLELAKKSK
jgi:hypothetical protein